MRFLVRVATAVAVAMPAIPVLGQVSEAPDPLFQDDETLHATITAPLSTLVRERPKDDYLPGVFEYTETDGSTIRFDLEIRTRGHFRHEHCDYPPVLLNLKRRQTDGTLFEHQNKLKLVIQCDRSERYEQVVLREYLAYRILNAVTDRSFRVRLLRVTYVNTEDRKNGPERYAFLIEHKNRVAERLDLDELKIERTSVSAIQADQLNLTSMFEYLIGNTDFSPIAGAPDDECCHNYVLFGKGDHPLVAIPYDFDQSGFVDSPYAAPNTRFRIRDVKTRLYRGRCVNNEHLEATFQNFRDNRSTIYALIEGQEGLESGVRRRIARYVDDFYDLIDDPRAVEQKVIDKCL